MDKIRILLVDSESNKEEASIKCKDVKVPRSGSISSAGDAD
jgi:hypothetical protein